MTEKRRITVTLSAEISEGVEKLKKEQYYNVPYAELLRKLLEAGLNAETSKTEAETNREVVI